LKGEVTIVLGGKKRGPAREKGNTAFPTGKKGGEKEKIRGKKGQIHLGKRSVWGGFLSGHEELGGEKKKVIPEIPLPRRTISGGKASGPDSEKGQEKKGPE